MEHKAAFRISRAQIVSAYNEWHRSNDEELKRNVWALLPPFIDYAFRRTHYQPPDIIIIDDMKEYALNYLMRDVENKRFPEQPPDSKTFWKLFVVDAMTTMHRHWVRRIRAKRDVEEFIEVHPDWAGRYVSTDSILGGLYLEEIPGFIRKHAARMCRFPKLSRERRMTLFLVDRWIASDKYHGRDTCRRFGIDWDHAPFFDRYSRFLCKAALFDLREVEGYDSFDEFALTELREEPDNTR